MRFVGAVYRAHNPEWAFDPLSGEGARLYGGRFNAKGVAALYTALDVLTAVREASPLGAPFQPMTLCQYDVDCDDVVDARRAEEREAFEIAAADLASPNWRGEMLAGKSPASQALAARLAAGGAAGLIAPSFARGAPAGSANLILWRWSGSRPHRIALVDPDGRLPHNRESWRR